MSGRCHIATGANGIIKQASETGPLADKSDPMQSVYLVPSFVGMGPCGAVTGTRILSVHVTPPSSLSMT